MFENTRENLLEVFESSINNKNIQEWRKQSILERAKNLNYIYLANYMESL